MMSAWVLKHFSVRKEAVVDKQEAQKGKVRAQ